MPRGGTKKNKKSRSEKVARSREIRDDDLPEGMTRATALEYVNEIKKEFYKNPEVYTEFTQILKDFDNFEISTDDFINKVCGLFSEKPHLVTGLNRFLPSGFKISKDDDGQYRCKVQSDFSKGQEKTLKLGHEYTGNGNTAKKPTPPAEAVPKREAVVDVLGEDEAKKFWEAITREAFGNREPVEEFTYDVHAMQELYKAYCKERVNQVVSDVEERGRDIRRMVVPLLEWMKEYVYSNKLILFSEYYTDTRKGLLFTKMIRSIKKILMLETRYRIFNVMIAASLGDHAFLVKKEFLDQHCMAYHRLVEGYMQTNELFKEVDARQPRQCSSKS